MDKNTKDQIKPYILEYLKTRFPNTKIGKKGMFKCPHHDTHEVQNDEPSANIFPVGSHKVHCFDPSCGALGDIFQICRNIDFDGDKDVTDDDIAEFLMDEFKIKINNDIKLMLEKYSKLGWDLVPCSRGSKASNVEKEWQTKSHKDPIEWQGWLDCDLNIGVKCGKMSNVLCLDFDIVPSELKKKIYEGKGTKKDLEKAITIHENGIKTIKEKLPFLNWETVTQSTFGGVHAFVVYENDIPKTSFNWEGIHIDIESEGGQVVIEPSTVGGKKRIIKGNKVLPMSDELKKWILDNSKTVKNEESPLINTDTDITFENLNGNCNNTFISLYGKLRKIMPIKSADYTLGLFNKLLDKPMLQKDVKAMSREAEKYYTADIKTISENIIEHLKLVNSEVHLRDFKEVLNVERKDLEQALRSLIDDNRIYKVKKDLYKLIVDIKWRTDFLATSKPLGFEVPYFQKYARFTSGSMIVVGGKTGTGKTVTVINMIEQFVKQGLCPKLITTEADSGIGEISLARGLKEGDFEFYQTTNPTQVPFKPNEVRIIDWLKAPNSEFFKLDTIYEELNNKLVENGGLLIVMAQLRKSNGTFYSEDMVEQFASFVGKFYYPERNGDTDNLNPIIETTKIRRPKMKSSIVKIPLTYIPESKELRLK